MEHLDIIKNIDMSEVYEKMKKNYEKMRIKVNPTDSAYNYYPDDQVLDRIIHDVNNVDKLIEETEELKKKEEILDILA